MRWRFLMCCGTGWRMRSRPHISATLQPIFVRISCIRRAASPRDRGATPPKIQFRWQGVIDGLVYPAARWRWWSDRYPKWAPVSSLNCGSFKITTARIAFTIRNGCVKPSFRQRKYSRHIGYRWRVPMKQGRAGYQGEWSWKPSYPLLSPCRCSRALRQRPARSTRRTSGSSRNASPTRNFGWAAWAICPAAHAVGPGLRRNSPVRGGLFPALHWPIGGLEIKRSGSCLVSVARSGRRSRSTLPPLDYPIDGPMKYGWPGRCALGHAQGLYSRRDGDARHRAERRSQVCNHAFRGTGITA